MDLLNLSDGIFREFVHTPDMDSRCAHRSARPHLRRTELADDVCYMLKVLYIFSGGEQDTVPEPDSTVIFDKFGNLYGTTQWGARSARIDAPGGR
jgi:hypothetical protein